MSFISDYNKFSRKIKNLIKSNNYIDALALLKEGLAKEPKNSGFQLFYFGVLIKLNRFEEALSCLKKFLDKFDDKMLPEALYYKGLYHFLKGSRKKSIELLRQCFTKDIDLFKKSLYDISFDKLRDTQEFQDLIAPKEVFEGDKFISLKLLFSKTLIFVCGDLFLTCQKVVLNIPIYDISLYNHFKNIDDIMDFDGSTSSMSQLITPEEEFWGHCSNIQAWVEHDYDTHILAQNLSFSIISELSNRGIPRFKTILKEELIYRIKEGGLKTVLYFIEQDYLKYLTEDDLFDNLVSLKEAEILREIVKPTPFEYTLTTNLQDSRNYPYLRNSNKMHFCVKDGHLTELEIIIFGDQFSEDYLNILLKLEDLKYLNELAIYRKYPFNNISEDIYENFIISLKKFNNLKHDLLSLY